MSLCCFLSIEFAIVFNYNQLYIICVLFEFTLCLFCNLVSDLSEEFEGLQLTTDNYLEHLLETCGFYFRCCKHSKCTLGTLKDKNLAGVYFQWFSVSVAQAISGLALRIAFFQVVWPSLKTFGAIARFRL